jgi:hypothetical protein
MAAFCALLACAPAGGRPPPPPTATGGSGGDPAAPDAPTAAPDASVSGGGASGSGGGGGSGGAGSRDASPGETSAEPDGPPAPSSGQGPIAEGRIAFSQDFEAGMEGITRSPNNLPIERAQIVDDPLGQRGKVMKVEWRAGDDFQTGGGSTHTRSMISNTGFSFPYGSTVHYAWGYMTTSRQIDAAFAQHIRPGGPMWLMEGNGDGTTYVNCRSCGGKANLPVQLEPNRWYDIRVEMTYSNGGPLLIFVNGAKVLERRMTVSDPAGTRAHWDAGIYNHAAGTTTRTVFISNLSVGMK